ncbi:CapA family protein [Treponema sp.]|uniref:CapA family protein n=1 Tax=Treponema sp. TaxID=166 RepID=UPI003F09D4BD
MLSATVLLTLASCRTTSLDRPGLSVYREEPPTAQTFLEGKLLLTFAGDIMAHSENTRGNFSCIYADIQDLVRQADFSFANLETSVDDSKDYSSYPRFNVKEEYADAAINAGFSVFSLANNHSNDFGKQGLEQTRKYFEKKQMLLSQQNRPLYFSGIKKTKNDPVEFILIEKKGWKIMFAAVTEILNQTSGIEYVNFISPTEKKRAQFLELVRQKKSECDLLILSLHCAEEEYVLTIAENQKKFYHSLIEAGVDVLWINHPHVSKEWELVSTGEIPRKIIFYSMGNTISGQRRNPDFSNPQGIREYTGDGLVAQVAFEKDSSGARISWVNPVLVTTLIDSENYFVIRKLNDEFLNTLEDNSKWKNYLSERKKIMEKIKGKNRCQ